MASMPQLVIILSMRRCFLRFTLRLFYVYPREIIDNDGEEQYEDIHGLEDHVEIAAGCEEQFPAVPVVEQEKQACDNDKEEQELQ